MVYRKSDVNGLAVNGCGGLHEGLGEGGMGVDGVVNGFGSGLKFHSEGVFGNQFGSICADDVGTEDFTVFFGDENFDKSLAVVGGDGLAGGGKGEFADLVGNAVFLEGALGFANAGDLRLAVGASGKEVDLFRFSFAEDSLDSLNGLVGGNVGEPGGSNDVTGGEDPLDGGLVVFVDDEIVSVEFGFKIFGKGTVDVRNDADREQESLGFDGFGFTVPNEVHADAVIEDLDVLDLGVGVAGDALFFESAFDSLARFIVLDGENPGKHFNEGYLGAEGIQKIGEFRPNRTGPHDDDGFGLFFEDEGLAGGHHAGAVDFEIGQGTGLAASGEEDVFGVELLALAVTGGQGDNPGGIDAAFADDVIDLVLAEEKFDPTGHPVGDIAGAPDDFLKIEADLADGQAHILGMKHGLVEFGTLQKGF